MKLYPLLKTSALAATLIFVSPIFAENSVPGAENHGSGGDNGRVESNAPRFVIKNLEQARDKFFECELDLPFDAISDLSLRNEQKELFKNSLRFRAIIEAAGTDTKDAAAKLRTSVNNLENIAYLLPFANIPVEKRAECILNYKQGVGIMINTAFLLENPGLADPGKVNNTVEGAVAEAKNLNLAIPDNNSTGTGVDLLVKESGPVGSIGLDLDILHTNTSDLTISLVSPNNVVIPIFNHQSGKNLQNRFGVGGIVLDSDALDKIKGTEMHGVWRVKVADTSNQDQGTISSAKVTVLPLADPKIVSKQPQMASTRFTNPVTIPDNNTSGLTAGVYIPNTMNISSISARVKITHPHPSDLQVFLISPDGQAVTLERNASEPSPMIDHTFGIGGTSIDISQIVNKDAKGLWKLKVLDTSNSDIGTLNGFDLTITP